MSLRFLILPQMLAALDVGAESIGISADGPYCEELESMGLRHLSLPSSTRGMDLAADLRAARQFWSILREERPDVLHTHTPKPGVYGRILGRIGGVPIVINTVHGLYATPDDPLGKRMVVYALEWLAGRFSDRELVQSAEDLELMARWRLAPRSRLRLLGNGVDLRRFDRSRVDEDARDAIRRELGAKPDDIVVGSVGRLVAEKGFRELFAAASKLPDGYVVVCVGPEEPTKADGLTQQELDDARTAGIRLLGMRTDVDTLYAAMDVFVLPSHREGFPRAAMEASAMGLPVIASDIRGCREVVAHGENGLLVPVGDVQALERAIVDVGSHRETRADMSSAARERAVADFDERRVVRTVMSAYVDAARAKGLYDLASALSGPATEPATRSAVASDVEFMARLHSAAISTGFLPTLGIRFMRRLYRALVEYPEAVVLVAEDAHGPIGFVAGVTNTTDFYRYFLRRHGIAASVAAFARVVHPRALKRAIETLGYDSPGVDARAELLSMAVISQARGRGIGQQLGSALLTRLRERNAGAVRVVVGMGNESAVRLYRQLGFRNAAIIEIHEGESSLVLVSP